MKTGFRNRKVSPNYAVLKENARKMRREPTEAEKILWYALSQDRQGVRFRRQHVIGDFIVDFVCISKSLIIELDGGYHNDAEQKEFDTIRSNYLQQQGFTIIRFANDEVLNNIGHVIETIGRYL